MNWCQPHWAQLKQAVEDKGLMGLVAKSGEQAAENMVAGKFDPLMDSWGRINAFMLRSPALNGRLLNCPCCILVEDGQPDMVEKWIDGATTDTMNAALKSEMVQIH